MPSKKKKQKQKKKKKKKKKKKTFIIIITNDKLSLVLIRPFPLTLQVGLTTVQPWCSDADTALK